MSATSQGLVHWHDAIRMVPTYGKAAEAEARQWAMRIRDYIREDFPVPKHIELKIGGPVLMHCRCCGDYAEGTSSNLIGTFLDRHHYCDSGRAPVWACPCCGSIEFEHRWHCRACEEPRADAPVPLRFTSPREVVEQTTEFEVRRGGGVVTAWIRVGSLREALRAARAMYPHEPALVDLPRAGRSWGLDHKSK